MSHTLQQPSVLPLLIVISGPPASGKTTLAAKIASKFALPLFTKDTFKEMMYDNAGELPDLAMSRFMGKCSIDILQIITRQLLAHHISFVLEANFDAALFAPVLRAIAEKMPFRCIQIQMTCEGTILTERFRKRATEGNIHPGHQGLQYFDVMQATLAKGRGEAFDIPSDIVWVDTTDLTQVDYTSVFTTIAVALAR
jgi:predicted kinase